MKLKQMKAIDEPPPNSAFGFRLDKSEARKTGRFLAFFVLIYLVLWFGLTAIIPESLMQQQIAGAVAATFNGSMVEAEHPTVQLAQGKFIEISPLCTGLTELFIITAAILASIGIPLKKRLLGAAAGAIAVLALNLFRIFATISIILSTSSIELIDFAHNVLFRIFLLAAVAGIYIAWFYWAVKQTGLSKS